MTCIRMQVVQQRCKGDISAPLAPEPPFPTAAWLYLDVQIDCLRAWTRVLKVIIYNQSKHATNSVLADIRAVWGSNVRVIQTLEAWNLRVLACPESIATRRCRRL